MLGYQDPTILLIRRVRDFIARTSLDIVLAGFLILAILNLMTYFLGSGTLLASLENRNWGLAIAPFVFDSWGTIGGLLGVTILFAPILLGASSRKKKSLSLYFVLASIGIGVVSILIWDSVFNQGATFPFGASSIDIAAQAIIFTFSIFGMFELVYLNPLSDRYIRNSLAIIYLTLIATTLWFILYLEPIFVASNQYNWRAHEIAFIIGVLSTTIYVVLGSFTRRKEKQLESRVIYYD
jgi:hypothetical protein